MRSARFVLDSTSELTTHPTLSRFTTFVNFCTFNDIETISLFISGDQAHSHEFSEYAYSRAGEPKELFWMPGAGHVDFYDRTELIQFQRLTDFFQMSLISEEQSPNAGTKWQVRIRLAATSRPPNRPLRQFQSGAETWSIDSVRESRFMCN